VGLSLFALISFVFIVYPFHLIWVVKLLDFPVECGKHLTIDWRDNLLPADMDKVNQMRHAIAFWVTAQAQTWHS
jgi:hypothetical protein